MDLPSLPTDTFHKFRALAGTWILAASIVLPFSAAHFLRERMIDVARDVEILQSDASNDTEDVATLSARVAHPNKEATDLEAAVNAAQQSAPATNRAALESRLDTMKGLAIAQREELTQLGERTRAIRIRRIRLAAEVRRAEAIGADLSVVHWLTIPALVYGLVLALSGFLGWRRVQTAEDALLMLRLKAEEQALRELRDGESVSKSPASPSTA